VVDGIPQPPEQGEVLSLYGLVRDVKGTFLQPHAAVATPGGDWKGAGAVELEMWRASG